MRPWSYWFPDVLPHVPGCPQPLVEHELLRAAKVFFGRTRAWKVDSPVAAVLAGQADVTVPMASVEHELVRVESVRLDGKHLRLITTEALEAAHAGEWRTHAGSPHAYFLVQPGEVRLYPVPVSDAATGLTARVSIAPSDVSPGLPDHLGQAFGDAIQTGAKARLMLYPGRSWTSGELAGVYAQAFDRLVHDATVQAARSYGNARISSNVTWC